MSLFMDFLSEFFTFLAIEHSSFIQFCTQVRLFTYNKMKDLNKIGIALFISPSLSLRDINIDD